MAVIGNSPLQGGGGGASLPGIFSSQDQARLYRLMMLHFLNSPDELFLRFLDYAVFNEDEESKQLEESGHAEGKTLPKRQLELVKNMV